ncbi:ATP-binding protein [Streptacidiphilus fuscans]|uniref:ATP-binding protein n=1 Tax=Streptacidiphilus fuscans TaxID=2789292 RepID=A0A931B3W1_9ACTN|nr:ATP-binding protein [Streptacidiphilus fuscans]MBF9067463.1 ATP-binding protein [Streptacidiphilus fuscans]
MSETTGHHSAGIPGGELVPRGTPGAVAPYTGGMSASGAPGGASGSGEPRTDGRRRTGEVVAGELLLTVNGPEGSAVEPLPEHRRPQPPTPRNDAHGPLRYATGGLLEREEQCARLRELLVQGRSVRLTGPHGSGRSAVLEAVGASCAGLLPGGVVRLSAYRKPLGDLLQDLYAALGGAPGHRPARRELPQLLAGHRAAVLVDDVDFGGEMLDELMLAAPDCSFLIAATPDAATPTTGAPVEESRLTGLSRAGCLELLTKLACRSLDESERAWAVDLWFESEGLPLRFVQAAALLRHRELAIDALAGGMVELDEDLVPLPSVAESAAPAARIARGLSEPARAVLRLAAALGGDFPTPPHLPALVDVGHGEVALEELVEAGLAEEVPGGTHRLVEGTAALLAGEWPETGVRNAAQHFAWWTGHGAVTEAQIAVEAEVLLSVLRTDQDAGRHEQVVLLARACAPAFGLALRWGAWERALRHGLESARATGSVAEEAWFHHELGVLTFCAGAYERSRAELEASVALRGALADARGTANGRHVLELLDQAAVITGATAVGGARARGREDGLRRLAAFATRRTAGVAERREGPASRRQLMLAAASVVLMGLLGAGAAFGLHAFDGGSAKGQSVDVAPAGHPSATPSLPEISGSLTPSAPGTASSSAKASHSPSATASGSASAPAPSQSAPQQSQTTPASGGGATQPGTVPSTPANTPPPPPTTPPPSSPSQSGPSSSTPSQTASGSPSPSSGSTKGTASSSAGSTGSPTGGTSSAVSQPASQPASQAASQPASQSATSSGPAASSAGTSSGTPAAATSSAGTSSPTAG